MSDSVPSAAGFLRVECSTVESARQVVEDELHSFPPRAQRMLAVAIARRLRDERLLRSSVEECYEAGELARLWGRSREWVVRTFYASAVMPWGAIHRDGGGWLIPSSVAECYLAAHVPSEKVAAEKGARHGWNGEGKVFQRGEAADQVRVLARSAADCGDAVSAGACGFAGVSGG